MRFSLSPRHHPLACSMLSGALLVAVFSNLPMSLLAWVAMAPLFAVCLQRFGRARLFLCGYVTGAVFFAGSCYWIYNVMHDYGGLPVVVAAGVLLLFVLMFALFFGVFALLAGELAQRWRLKALFLFPFLWVGLEWVRTVLPFGGFPWNLLGYGVASWTGWIQPAAYTGIYGVSFLVAAVNAAVAAYWFAPNRRRLALLGVMATALVGTAVAGHFLPAEETDSHVVLVQPNLPQLPAPGSSWEEVASDALAAFEQMAHEAVRGLDAQAPPLVVWPEAPAHFYFHRDPVLRARLTALAQSTRSYLLLGTIDFRRDPGGEEDTRLFPYNSAVLISPTGGFVGQYDKIHLVPFGEYLPWGPVFGLAGALVDEVSDFRPGNAYTVLPVGENRLSVFICYEAIFPELVQEFADRGAQLLVNISNDGWFGRSSAAAQHLNMARMRAVESRRFLVRATNTGITTVVDPRGRLLGRLPSHERGVLTAGFRYRTAPSFYVQFGDWFASLCAFVTVLALLRAFWLATIEGMINADDG